MRSIPWAKSLLASESEHAPRLDTMLVRFPRCVLAEFNTHRVFSRNSASTRAIPTKRLIETVQTDPFIPLYWGKNQSGMQAFAEVADAADCERSWLSARDSAVKSAEMMLRHGLHKQIVGRLLEPFMWTLVVVTGTQWSNFLHLRDHPDAEPHMQMLARAIRAAYEGATVRWLQEGDWHLPFVGIEDYIEIAKRTPTFLKPGEKQDYRLKEAIKLSVARCASTSHKTVEGFDMTQDRASALHDKLVAMDPLHASPCEHCAQVDSVLDGKPEHPELSGNLAHGWAQYRKMLVGECR